MDHQWTDMLSPYIDGELDEPARLALEAHLAHCAECRTTLRQLEQVVWRARTLPDRPPSVDLWPSIAERIGHAGARRGTPLMDGPSARPRAPRRFSFTVPQLLAAGIALAFLSGGTVWLARMGGEAPGPGALPHAVSEPVAPPLSATSLVHFDGIDYDVAVADLERILAEHRDVLDPATVRVLEESLAAIDRAIEEVRAALAADPANAYLNVYLADNMRRKMQLLRRATAFVSAQS